MRVSEQGLALIRRFEGFSARPYLCPAGRRTVGYGHVIGAGEAFPEAGITPDQEEILLKQDVEWSEQAICRLVTTPLTQGQFDAVASLVYNIGIKAFEKSTLLRLLNLREPARAACQFGRWVYAAGRIQPGLVARRAAETAIFTG